MPTPGNVLSPERIGYLRRRSFMCDLSGHNPSIDFCRALDKLLNQEHADLLERIGELEARLCERNVDVAGV